VKQCVSCPGRGAAFFTLRRRAGTHGYGSIMDLGSAAHRHSASKTRVTALMALRSVRGTPNPHPEERPMAASRRMVPASWFETREERAPHHEARQHVLRREKFQIPENLFPETAPLASRNSAQRRRSLSSTDSAVVTPRRKFRRSHHPSGDDPCRSALHYCPPPPLARWL
jgi:hypothetical protein